MWCKQCQQDVPGLVSSDEGMFCCPRCNGALRVSSPDEPGVAAVGGQPPEAANATAAGTKADPLTPPYDDWELSEQLRHIQRVLGGGKESYRPGQTVSRCEAARLDPAHAGPPGRHAGYAVRPVRSRAAGAAEGGSILSALTWCVLSLGTMAFVCGSILLGWSLYTGRQELWTVGMPVGIGGQIALALGLVLQLDRLWHDGRRAAAKLESVDERLHQLNAATTLLGKSHASPDGAFYAHLAGGAGPEVLLSDLKGQLDLLALKMGVSDQP